MLEPQTKQEETLNTNETAIEKVRRLSKKDLTPAEIEQVKTIKSLLITKQMRNIGTEPET